MYQVQIVCFYHQATLRITVTTLRQYLREVFDSTRVRTQPLVVHPLETLKSNLSNFHGDIQFSRRGKTPDSLILLKNRQELMKDAA